MDTLIIFIMYCFSMATMVMQMYLMLCYLYITLLVLSYCSIKFQGIYYFLQYVILFLFNFAVYLELVGGHIYNCPIYIVRIHALYIFCYYFCDWFGTVINYEDGIYKYGIEVYSIVLYTVFNCVICSQDVQECFCFSLLMGEATATP